MSDQQCVIVGASHAGVQLALSLRQSGWQGGIRLLSEEDCAPYQRPPLSKDLLTGVKSLEQIPLRPPVLLEKAQVELSTGVTVTSIDRDRHELELADGSRLRWDKLALTTGCRPRQIPITGHDKEGVYCLRNAADVMQIRAHLQPGKRAVIVGGGYIGLETAASMRKLGMEVTILEAMPMVLQRVTSPLISEFFQCLHQRNGVDIHTGSAVESIEGDDRVEHVHLSNGQVLDADLVIMAVGVLPNTELAAAAGLEVNDGIAVDAFARTDDPDIVAAGDCTRHHNPIYDRSIRLESVQNATDQAKTAAATLCGDLRPYHSLPWFWSDQYEVKLQIAGLSQGYDNVVVRGDAEGSADFAVFYFAGERLLAVDAVNRPAEFMVAKKLILQGSRVDRATLADESNPPKSLLNP